MEVMYGWVERALLSGTPPWWMWCYLVGATAIVLGIFRVISGNWIGRENRETK